MQRTSPKAAFGLFALFFFICLGLGFSGLQRYDPATTKGLSDSRHYAAMVQGDGTADSAHAARILIPALSRPIAIAAAGHIGSWNANFFGLLVVNSVFIAFAALLLMRIGELTTRSRLTGLIAALLYLLTFNVASLYLDGLVDAVEAWAVIATIWLLLADAPLLLPVVAFIGAVGKETSIPLVLAMSVAWMIQSRRTFPAKTIVIITVAILAAQFAGIAAAQAFAFHRFVMPWQIGVITHQDSGTSGAQVITLLNREWIYAFGWLLPLGLLRVRSLPAPWKAGTAAALGTALLLSFRVGVGGNAARPAFNAIAPLLVMSAAIYLTELLGGEAEKAVS